MRRTLPLFWSIALAFISPVVNAQSAGYIQVVYEPGARVFLDENFSGETSSSEGGKILQDVPAGKHIVRIEKTGFDSQSIPVTVEAGKVFELRVSAFKQRTEVTQTGESARQNVVQKVGELLIQTLPIGCTISIPGVDAPTEKQKDEWRMKNVAVGNYTATVDALGKTVRAPFAIRQGETTHLFIDLLKGTVRDLSSPASQAAGTQAEQTASAATEGGLRETLEVAEASLDRGDLRKAEIEFTRIIQQWPNDNLTRRAYKFRGDLRRDKGEFDSALADYTLGVELMKDSPPFLASAVISRGITREGAGDFAAALADYDAAIGIPARAPAITATAVVQKHFVLKRLNRADNKAEIEAVLVSSNQPEIAFVGERLSEIAFAAMASAETNAVTRARFFYVLGMSCSLERNVGKARNYFNQSLEACSNITSKAARAGDYAYLCRAELKRLGS